VLGALDIPGVHVVPAAIAMGVDQTPEAQRWNEEPPARQNHAPSFLQATNWALEVVVVPPGAGTPADPTDDAAAVVDAPAVKLGAEDVAEEFEPDGAGVATRAEPVEGVPAATAEAEPHPGGTVFNLTPIVPFTTDIPGSGYNVSSPSTVVHPLLTLSILAINIAGKVFWRLETLGSGT
jgi:hypothetical protein